jgi:hypothetical protein
MALGNSYLEDGLITLRLAFVSCSVRPTSYTGLTEGGVRQCSLVLGVVNLWVLLPSYLCQYEVACCKSHFHIYTIMVPISAHKCIEFS